MNYLDTWEISYNLMIYDQIMNPFVLTWFDLGELVLHYDVDGQ